MSLIKQSHNVYMSLFDLDGLLTRLKHRIAEMHENGEAGVERYEGLRDGLTIFRFQEWVDTQDDFMRLFEAQMNKYN